MLRMNGPWRITVIGKDAVFDQRAVVRASYGTTVLAGRVGEFLDVREDEWELELEHSWNGRWCPNIRVRLGPVESLGSGERTQVIRSKDADWTGGHPEHPNFVLRLYSLAAFDFAATPAAETATAGATTTAGMGVGVTAAVRAGVPMTASTPAGQDIPVATQTIRTSSGPETGGATETGATETGATEIAGAAEAAGAAGTAAGRATAPRPAGGGRPHPHL
ncbi:hypothetical protein ACFVVX_37570 [Kitasatospora sp. NPDC058170]|uniref:hypothetical protein n=1 Tax=Kitasatospora sp. NPDC058170 TaxID=3346364 RepID=UPI0036DF3C29